MTYQLRRALLFIPGDSQRKLEKGAGLGVDTLILDLEDGVALNQKEEARHVIQEALQMLDFGRSEKLVRINPVGSGLEIDDLEKTIAGHPDGYVIPKVEEGAQIIQINDWLAMQEHERGWEPGKIRLFVYIESALAIVNLREIASSTNRLAGLMFGGGDFASNIGAIRTPESYEIFYARSATVTYAKAFGLQAFDTPFLDIENLIGLANETRQIMQMGYDGKVAIHPSHVSIIEKVFMPTPEQIEEAEALLAANEEHQRGGTGAFRFRGRMVDMPDVRAAQAIMARANASGRKP